MSTLVSRKPQIGVILSNSEPKALISSPARHTDGVWYSPPSPASTSAAHSQRLLLASRF